MSRLAGRVRVDRAPLEALEVAFRGLRWAAVALVGAWMFDGWASESAATLAVVAVAPAALVIANVASMRMKRSSALSRLVWAQISLDVIAVTAAVIGMQPSSVSPLWAALAFPVLEGAVRFRFNGAVASWAVLALALFGDRTARWSPGMGLEPLKELAYHLGTAFALGVVAGYLAEKLVAEMYDVAQEHADAEHRARLLAVLTVAGERLSRSAQHNIATIGTEAAIELGFDRAQLVDLADDANAELARRIDVTSERSIVELGDGRRLAVIGGPADAPMALVVTSEVDDEARDEAFGVLTSYLTTAAATAARDAALLASERRLRYEANHDHLTGLLNRAGLMGVAEQVSHSPNAATRLVAFIDLDGFKAVNDTYGHDIGDELLRAVGRRLDAAMPGAYVGRLGGDEFVVVSPERPGVAAQQLVELLGTVFDAPVPTPSGLIQAAGSVGVVHFDPVIDPSSQWRRADEAMYSDKAARRARRRSDAVEGLSVAPLRTEHPGTAGPP